MSWHVVARSPAGDNGETKRREAVVRGRRLQHYDIIIVVWVVSLFCTAISTISVCVSGWSFAAAIISSDAMSEYIYNARRLATIIHSDAS